VILTPAYMLYNIKSYILSISPEEQVLIYQKLQHVLLQRSLV
jgi:hypothetical protein